MLVLLVSALVLAANLFAAAVIIRGTRQMRSLGDIPPLEPERRPQVSIIVPARNEAATIEPALRSLLDLDYAPLEVIVVNDRSTDRTAEVLATIREKHPQLEVLDIDGLPDGWLGKSHALHRGAGLARGEYLLFTDADIHFEPSTLARAMTLMTGGGLDHLALVFRNTAAGPLLNAMMIDAGAGLFLLFQPWKAADPTSRSFIGVGAFNLVRKSAYLAVGGHEPIRMHPIDDIMLGKHIKRGGFRQACLAGRDFIRVRWYESPRAMIDGLMKNIFALFHYRVSLVLAAALLVFLTAVLPAWGVVLTSGTARLFFALTVGVRLLSAAAGVRLTTASPWSVPCILLTPYLTMYMLLRAMLQTLAAGGIVWRGTRYPLDRLRQSPPLLWP